MNIRGRQALRPALEGTLGGGPIMAPTIVAPARFEATVYEVQVPANRIADLDAQALEAKDTTAQGFADKLAGFGKTKVMYKVDQTINLYGENISLMKSEPMITGTRMNATGQAFNTVTYQNVGLIVRIAAGESDAKTGLSGFGRLNARVDFSLAALGDSEVEIAPKVKASSIRNVQLSHSEQLQYGKPVVQLNVSTPSGSDSSSATAYVVRYAFKPENPAPSGTGN